MGEGGGGYSFKFPSMTAPILAIERLRKTLKANSSRHIQVDNYFLKWGNKQVKPAQNFFLWINLT